MNNHKNMQRTYYRNHFKRLRLRENISQEERTMLEQTVRVDDGTIGEVVTFRKAKTGELIYECHLCKCFAPNLTYEHFLEHFNGQSHAKNLKKTVHSRNKFLVRYPNRNLKLNINVGPLLQCTIQSTLDRFKEPLIGLEYLVEIKSSNKLSYHCLLCDKLCETSCIINHLISSGHYIQYFYIFFRTAADHLNSIKGKISKNKYKEEITVVAKRIESFFGRLKPRQITSYEMDNINKILDDIDRGPHFWETPSQTFVEDVKRDKKEKQEQSNSAPFKNNVESHIQSRGSLSSRDKVRDKSGTDFRNSLRSRNSTETSHSLGRSDYGWSRQSQQEKREQVVAKQTPRFLEKDNGRGDKVDDFITNNVDPAWFDEDERRFQEYTHSSPATQLLWQQYLEGVKGIETNLKEEFVYYQKNPEKHPKYDIERKSYYRKRTEHLLRRGLDSMKYDIRGEFIALWDTILQEILDDILKKEKAQLRVKLRYIFNNQMGQGVKVMQPPSEVGNYKSAANKRDYESSAVTSNKRMKVTPKLSVITVVRHLTVLENYLGSLGPKVVDLLSEALMMEKSSNSPDSILLIEKNCMLLETVKEKLIGLVQAEMIESSMAEVTERAICNISSLLATVPENKSQTHPIDKEGLSDRWSYPIEGQSFHKKASPDRQYVNIRSHPDTEPSFNKKSNPDIESFNLDSYPDKESSFYKSHSQSNPSFDRKFHLDDKQSSFDSKSTNYPDGGSSFDIKSYTEIELPFNKKSYPEREPSFDKKSHLDVGSSISSISNPDGVSSFDKRSNLIVGLSYPREDEKASFKKTFHSDLVSSFDSKSYTDAEALFDKRSHSDVGLSFARKSFPDLEPSFDKISHSNIESSFSIKSNPYGQPSFNKNANPNMSFDRKSYTGGESTFHRRPDCDGEPSFDKRSHPDKVQLFNKNLYPDKNLMFNRMSYNDERKSCTVESNLHVTPYADKRQPHDFEKTKFSQEHSKKDSSLIRNHRMIKVSEIGNFIEHVNILFHLTYLDRISMAQEIASNLIFQRQTEVTEDFLLEIIKTFVTEKQRVNDELSSGSYFDRQTSGDNFNKQTSSPYQQKSTDVNHFKSPLSDVFDVTPLSEHFSNAYQSPPVGDYNRCTSPSGDSFSLNKQTSSANQQKSIGHYNPYTRPDVLQGKFTPANLSSYESPAHTALRNISSFLEDKERSHTTGKGSNYKSF